MQLCHFDSSHAPLFLRWPQEQLLVWVCASEERTEPEPDLLPRTASGGHGWLKVHQGGGQVLRGMCGPLPH